MKVFQKQIVAASACSMIVGAVEIHFRTASAGADDDFSEFRANNRVGFSFVQTLTDQKFARSIAGKLDTLHEAYGSDSS